MSAASTLGVQACVWNEGRTLRDLHEACAGAAGLGYDLVEVTVPDPGAVTAPAEWRSVADDSGVRLGMVTAQRPDADVSSPDASIHRAGVDHLRRSITLAHELGATVLGGVHHSALGRQTQHPAAGAIERSRDGIAQVVDEAVTASVVLGLEAVNRYGSHLVNTAAQAVELCDGLPPEAVGVHLDTFHMHIEEADVAAAVRTAGARLVHVHVAESDRGSLGQGRFPFQELFSALSAIRYPGAIVLEAFSPSAAPGVSAATASWRDLWSDPADFAAGALQFLQLHLDHETESHERTSA